MSVETPPPSEPIPAPAPAPRETPWGRIALVFVAFWIVYLIVARPTDRLLDLDGPGPGTKVGYDWSLQDLDGKPVSFADFRGKTLFVNIWATWCPPCIGEMPSIAGLAATPGLRDDVTFLCIATDESVDDVKRFVEARGRDWTMTVLHAQALPAVFLTEGIPATFFVAPDGRLAYEHVGAADWNSPAVVQKLRDLAATAR